tara:strand:- start:356 stop:619 length:264 start_codon:yes stop_codon:yes gene_type:complete
MTREENEIISGQKRRRRVSPSARKRMSEAQKLRWAKKKTDELNGKTANVTDIMRAGGLCIELLHVVDYETADSMLRMYHEKLGGTNA